MEVGFAQRQVGDGDVRGRDLDDLAGDVVAVEDDGIGIDPVNLKQIFERFRQINREKLEQQGVGLGLALADRLVDLHGGRIHVESEPGEGSTFAVYLPVDGGQDV